MKQHWPLALILLIGALLRLPYLGELPPPLNQDEASRGYDAWCILETGADRHGQAWPLFLRSFGPGDYTAALSTYLTIPFVAILGPTAQAMRLPNAILGVAAVWLMYMLMRPGMGRGAGLVAAGMLACDPWHVGLTRTGHESGFAPFFLVLGIYGMCRAGVTPWPGSEEQGDGDRGTEGTKPSGWMGFVGSLSLGMAAWVYPATRLFTPLLVVAVVVVFRSEVWRLLRAPGRVAAVVSGIVVGGAPLWITAAMHPEQLAARASITLLEFDGGDRIGALAAFASNYWRNISPWNLFISTEDMSGAALGGIGQHLLIAAPLLALGVWSLVTSPGRRRWATVMLIWLLLYPVPAAICRDWNPHPMRTVAGIALMAMIAGWGWAVVERWAAERAVRRGAALAIVCAAMVNIAYYGIQYRAAIRGAEAHYQAPLRSALEFVAGHEGRRDFVLVSSRANQAYIYVLLAEPVAPRELRGLTMVAVPGRLGFDQVIRLGTYFFAPARAMDAEEARRVFAAEWEEIPAGSVGLVVQTEAEEENGELLARFPCRGREESSYNYQVRRWTKSP